MVCDPCEFGHRWHHHGWYGGLAEGCCSPWSGRFPKRQEQIEILEDYKEWLQKRLSEVEEQLTDLRKGS